MATGGVSQEGAGGLGNDSSQAGTHQVAWSHLSDAGAAGDATLGSNHVLPPPPWAGKAAGLLVALRSARSFIVRNGVQTFFYSFNKEGSASQTSCVTTHTHRHEGRRSPAQPQSLYCVLRRPQARPPPPPPRSLISRKPSGGPRKESTCFYFFLSLRRSQCCRHALRISKTEMAGGGIAHTLTLVRGVLLGLTGSKTREALQKALERPVVHLTHWP